MKTAPIEFYDVKGNRTRAHFSRDELIELGIRTGEDAAFAVLTGVPVRLLLTNDFTTRGGSIVARDDKEKEFTGFTMTHFSSTSDALRIERKKGARLFPLPERFEGTYRVLRQWDGGAVLELNYSIPTFNKPAVQRGLGGI